MIEFFTNFIRNNHSIMSPSASHASAANATGDLSTDTDRRRSKASLPMSAPSLPPAVGACRTLYLR
jgi:hypothetical protein